MKYLHREDGDKLEKAIQSKRERIREYREKEYL